MNLIMDYFRRNWINYLIFVLFLAASLYVATFPQEIRIILRFLPFVLLSLSLMLAVLFNKSKTFLIALLSAIALLVLMTNQMESRFFQQLYLIMGIAVPLNYIWIARSHEKGIFSVSGRFKLIFIGFQALMFLYFLLFQESWMEGLLAWQILPRGLSRLMAPTDAVLIVFLVLMFAELLQDFLKRDSNYGLRFFSLATLLLAFLKPNHPAWYSLFMSANGLYLSISLMTRSYTMAYHDDLTGIPGRRALNEELHKLSGHFSIAMIDIDHFKKFNDQHGHDVGDEALRHVAQVIKRTVRGGRVFRFGGEEFTILYPGFEMSHALINLEEIRRAVETTPLNAKSLSALKSGARRLKITISIGAAQRDNFNRASEVLREADHALYRSKENGRNRICH